MLKKSIEVANINPLLQKRLRVEERCMFQLRRLIWGEDQRRYHPLYKDWLAAAVVGVDCP